MPRVFFRALCARNAAACALGFAAFASALKPDKRSRLSGTDCAAQGGSLVFDVAALASTCTARKQTLASTRISRTRIRQAKGGFASLTPKCDCPRAHIRTSHPGLELVEQAFDGLLPLPQAIRPRARAPARPRPSLAPLCSGTAQ
eukprot:779968-Rhodomonas_salina.3